MPNAIEFAVIDDDSAVTVVPLIDGTSLVALVAKLEMHYSPGHDLRAGHYQGHVLDDLTETRANYYAPRTTILLSGEAGCGSLEALIERTDTIVRWSNFSNAMHPTWDYSALGPFEFDREQYNAALIEIHTPSTMGA
jgi:hypothetical protein